MNARERDVAKYTWLSLKQAGEALGGASSHQVRRWIEDGELTAFDASRKDAKRKDYRIAPEWLEAFKEKRTRNAEAA